MGWAPRPYRSTKLPAVVLDRGTKHPEVRELLRANPFLPYRTWKELLGDHGSSWEIRYLTKNLDRRKAGQLLQAIPELTLGSRALSDIDLALSSWYNQDEIGETTGKRILASGLPNVAGVALRSPKLRKGLKAQLAEQSYRPHRLLWLTSAEADHLGATELWRIARLPENLEECCEGTALDDMMRTETLQYSAALLAQRPELIGPALHSEDPWWLMAAAAVPLDDQQQQTLLSECEKHWGGEEAEEILTALSRHTYRGNTAPDPVGLLGTTPWCTQETWAHLERNASDPSPTSWVEDGVLVRRDPLGYTRTITLRHSGAWPALELATATPEEAGRWAEWAMYSDLLCAPFVALELRKNRHAGARAARLRRSALLRHGEALYGILTRNGFEKLPPPYRYRCSEPEKESPSEKWIAFGDCPVQHALLVADGGFAELEAAGLTAAEWESALVLHTEFTGTVADLIGVVQAL